MMNIVNHQNVQRLKARPISAMETKELLTHSISNDTWQTRDAQQLNRHLSHENLLKRQHFLSEPRPRMTFQSYENLGLNQPIRNFTERRIPFKANRVQFINNFDGNFRNFNDFFQPFCNNVDKTDLDDATKLQILKSKLDAKTRTWLDGYSGDDDYENAKQTLLRHFHSMFALKNDVLKKFAELQPPEDDYDLDGYRQIMISARSSYMNLKRAGADAFTVTLLTKQIKGKLSPIRLSILEERQDNDNIEKVIKYLEDVVNRLQDNADPFLVNNIKFGRNTKDSLQEFQNSCNFCGDSTHSTKNCNRVKTFAERKQLAREAGLCSACFQPGHTSRFCKNTEYCTSCDDSHKLINCPMNQNWRSQMKQRPNNGMTKEQAKPNLINSISATATKLNNLDTPENSDESDHEQGECFSVNNKKKKSIPQILTCARINDKEVTVLLDPGSNINIISKLQCKKLKLNVFKRKVSIKVTEHRFKSFQACMANMKLGTIKRKVVFQLVDDDDIPILLGRNDIHGFKITLFPGDNELIPMQLLQRSKTSKISKNCYHVEAEHKPTEKQKYSSQQNGKVSAKIKPKIGKILTEKTTVEDTYVETKICPNQQKIDSLYECLSKVIELQHKIVDIQGKCATEKVMESQIKKIIGYHSLITIIIFLMFFLIVRPIMTPVANPVIPKQSNDEFSQVEKILKNQNQLIQEFTDHLNERIISLTNIENVMKELSKFNDKLNKVQPQLKTFLSQMQITGTGYSLKTIQEMGEDQGFLWYNKLRCMFDNSKCDCLMESDIQPNIFRREQCEQSKYHRYSNNKIMVKSNWTKLELMLCALISLIILPNVIDIMMVLWSKFCRSTRNMEYPTNVNHVDHNTEPTKPSLGTFLGRACNIIKIK